jgi:hypothetical protein
LLGTDKKDSDEEDAIVGSGSPLDSLRKELRRKVTRPEVLIAIPDRPGVELRFSPNITQEQLGRWRKAAGGDSKKGLNSQKFSALVIGSTMTGILLGGELVTNEDDVPLNIASPEIMESLEAERPVPEGVQEFIGNDPAVEIIALKIMELAGWGEDVDASEEDPTGAS